MHNAIRIAPSILAADRLHLPKKQVYRRALELKSE